MNVESKREWPQSPPWGIADAYQSGYDHVPGITRAVTPFVTVIAAAALPHYTMGAHPLICIISPICVIYYGSMALMLSPKIQTEVCAGADAYFTMTSSVGERLGQLKPLRHVGGCLAASYLVAQRALQCLARKR